MKVAVCVGVPVVLALLVAGVTLAVAWNQDTHGARFRVKDYSASPNALWSTYYTSSINDNNFTFGKDDVLHGFWRWQTFHNVDLIIPAGHHVEIYVLPD